MTPLDRLTAGRISTGEQWSARHAICQHVNGGQRSPQFRRGSNSWRDSANFVECMMNDALALLPCPNCGAPSDDFLPGPGYEYCPACKTEIQKGDYDWFSLTDCLRYRADLESGAVETEAEIFRCSKCRRPHSEAWPNWPAAEPGLDCKLDGCPLYCSPEQQAAVDAAAAAKHEKQLTDLRARPRTASPPQPSALDAVLARMGGVLDEAIAHVGAAEGETLYDARRRNFDRETAAAAERDRRRQTC